MKTYIIDFEFLSLPGCNPRPWCVAYHCLETGEENTIWLDGQNVSSPFPENFRMVAHYALAELGCFLELGWKLPTEVIDTLPEARVVRGQVPTTGGSWGLLAVATQLGIPTMSSDHKDTMRQLAMGDEIPLHSREDLMRYCMEDVHAGHAIWQALMSQVNIQEAILRGRYLKALSQVERRGLCTDVDMVQRLMESMPEIREAAWAEARKEYPGVIDADGRFSSKAWLEWCIQAGIPWPRLKGGSPALDADTFKKLGDRYPAVQTMAYARKLRGQGRKFEFPLGDDSRLRCMLSPFSSDTGRNQPSNSRFIFGASAWLRSVIMADDETVLAYVDYSAQEVGLAAALSGDEALVKDYQSGDPYMAFAIRAGAAPEGATKKTHPSERATYKTAALAIQYGIGDEALGQNLGVPTPNARRLITAHQAAYPTYWRWRGAIVDEVMCGGSLSTRYGWTRKAKPKDSANSIANFPVQAAGGEILRTAVIALEEAGLRVVAPVHDALLVELDLDCWKEALAHARYLMEEAAMAVTGGLRIPTDVELVSPLENYIDGRGAEFWNIAGCVTGRMPYRLQEDKRLKLPESQI
jgi:DNA polymerase-1